MKTIRKKVVSLLSAACLIATSAAMFALPASAKELTNVIDESTTYYVRNNATGKYLSAIDPSINTPGALGMKDLSRDNTYLKFRFHHVSGELEPADGGAYTMSLAASPAFYVSNNTTPSNVFDDSVFTSTTKYSRWYIRQTSDGVVIESGLNSSALRMYATDGVYNNRYGKTEPGNVFLGGSGYVRNDVWTLVRESDVPAEPKQAGRHYWQGDGGLYLAVSYRGQPAIGDGMYLTSDAVPPIYMIEWIDTDRFVMRLDSYAFDNYLYLSQKDGKIIMDVRGNADIYTIKEEISGKYSIVNRSNYAITRTADNKVVLSPYTGSSNQLWMLGM